MKKIDLGQSIGILANIGVIAGIAFLAFELRRNTVAVRSEASQGLQNEIGQIYAMLIDDPLTDIYLRAMEDPTALDATERAKLRAFLALVFAWDQNLYLQVREGTYDAEFAQGYWQNLRNMMEYPIIRDFWGARSFTLSEEFRQFVEADVMRLTPMSGTVLLPGLE